LGIYATCRIPGEECRETTNDSRPGCGLSPGKIRDFELGAGARVEPVALGVAEKVEGKYGEHDGERGKDEQEKNSQNPHP
jgi:hypothetical protein